MRRLDLRLIVETVSFIVIAALILLTPKVVLPALLGTEVPLAVIESGSMERTLHIGDVVIVRGASPREIKTGDIIVFRAKFLRGSLAVHRVIKVVEVNGRIYFLTKGDANVAPDPLVYGVGSVSEEDLKGKVIAKIPLVGYMTLTFSTILSGILGFLKPE